MNYRNFLFPFILLLLLTSCANTKYTYHFEKGRMLDFTQGEWILNRPYTNSNQERIEKIAIREFRKILGDSLIPLDELKAEGLAVRPAFEPSREYLLELKAATGKDYLINLQSNIMKSEMGSFAHAPSVGTTTKINEAGIIVKIFDLKTLELISESTVTGTAEATKTEDDHSWDYVNSAETLSMKGLSKLIKRYRKYGITN